MNYMEEINKHYKTGMINTDSLLDREERSSNSIMTATP